MSLRFFPGLARTSGLLFRFTFEVRLCTRKSARWYTLRYHCCTGVMLLLFADTGTRPVLAQCFWHLRKEFSLGGTYSHRFKATARYPLG